MLYLQGLRNRSFTAVIAQWLVVLFLLQAMLPVQAHSRIDADDHGTPVVICTLQGDKTVIIHFDDPQQSHADALPSAAMLFSDLLNDLSPTHAVVRPPMRVLGRIQASQELVVHVASQAIVDASSRAPPRA